MRLSNIAFSLLSATTLIHCGNSCAALTVETFESFSTGTILTNQIPGLEISAPPTGVSEIRTASNPVVPGEPQGLAHIPYLVEPNYLVIDFLPGANQAGAIVDFGTIGSGVAVTAFDGAGATGNILGTQSTTTETFIGVVAAGIRSIRFENLGGASYLIDNLTYELVPEPSSLILLSLGLLATTCPRRK